MKRQLYVNIEVEDLARSMDFFLQLGLTVNLKCTNENAVCLVINDFTSVMCLHKKHFRKLVKTEVMDTKPTNNVLLSLTVESKERVNEMVDMALELGATELNEARDYGTMFSRSFYDLDGYLWEMLYVGEE